MQLTNSSIGILKEVDTSTSGVIAGTPKSIRSDEYLRTTPDFLGTLKFEATQTQFDISSMPAADPVLDRVKKIMESSPDQFLVNSVADILPRDSGFSLRWWYTTFLTAIVVPIFLRKLGVAAKHANAATLLLIVSPSSQWWSNSPLSFISSACFSGLIIIHVLNKNPIFFHNRKNWAKFALSLIGILVLIPIPMIYPPWSIPVCVVVGSIVIGHLIHLRGIGLLNTRLMTYVFSTIFIAFTIKFLLSFSAITAVLQTVYPGQRRALESGSGLTLFSTNLISHLASSGQALIVGNQSELSSTMLEFLVIFISIVPLIFLVKNKSELYYPILAAYIPSVIFFSWIFPIWPKLFLAYNPLTLIPPDRMAQILSMISILLFFTLLTYIQEAQEKDRITLTLAYFGLLTPVIVLVIMGNQRFLSFFKPNTISTKEALLGLFLLIVALVGFVVTRKYFFEVSVGIMAYLCIFPLVNPVQIGSGDITGSRLATSIAFLDKDRSEVWACDSIWLDAILMANS